MTVSGPAPKPGRAAQLGRLAGAYAKGLVAVANVAVQIIVAYWPTARWAAPVIAAITLVLVVLVPNYRPAPPP